MTPVNSCSVTLHGHRDQDRLFGPENGKYNQQIFHRFEDERLLEQASLQRQGAKNGFREQYKHRL
jgi:hypothetical protein